MQLTIQTATLGLLLIVSPAGVGARGIDIVYVIETTVRMAPAKASVMRILRHQLAEMEFLDDTGQIRLAVVDYRDRGDPYVVSASEFFPFSNSQRVIERVDGLLFDGGGDDYSEAAYSGIRHAVEEMNWSGEEGERRVVVFAGAPPHRFDLGEPSPGDLIRAANDKGIRIDVVGFPTLNVRGEREFLKIAEATGGEFARFGRRVSSRGSRTGGRASKGGLTWKPGDETVRVERYPTIECPDEVVAGSAFAVMVSLTEDLITETTDIRSGEQTKEGKLVLSLPPAESWEISVTLSAPGFSVKGQNFTTFTLPLEGDSSPALFKLVPKEGSVGQKSLYAVLYHETLYLGRISRRITVIGAGTVRDDHGGQAQGDTEAAQARATSIGAGSKYPELTVTILGSRGFVDVRARNLQPAVENLSVPPELGAWLESHYERFLQETPRGLTVARAESAKEPVRDQLKGFGRQLYKRFAPRSFKQAFWRLHDQLGDQFQSIQIVTDSALLPWELMVPSREDGSEELDFLGVTHRIARWHLGEGGGQLERPPQVLTLGELVVVAPAYRGDQALPSQEVEMKALSTVPGYRRVTGRYAQVKAMFAQPPEGIIHFAGHGVIRDRGSGATEYAIQLEDFELDLLAWRGLSAPMRPRHPFIFFNACDVGNANRSAGFVDGWAPAVLDAGSSGYVGGLWPLGDKGAAAFSAYFYSELKARLNDGPVVVADLLRDARRLFYETGDPTYLAYVYYGDPNFRFQREN